MTKAARRQPEHFRTRPKIGRGRAQRSLDIIEAMNKIAEECRPITGRGVGYKLFSLGLIPSMSKMQGVYRLLKEAREERESMRHVLDGWHSRRR
jgi:hypothetical protein